MQVTLDKSICKLSKHLILILIYFRLDQMYIYLYFYNSLCSFFIYNKLGFFYFYKRLDVEFILIHNSWYNI